MSVHSEAMTRQVQNDQHQCQHADDGEESFNSKRSSVRRPLFDSTPVLLFA